MFLVQLLVGEILKQRKPQDPVPGGEKKDRMNEANRKPVAPPPRPKLKKFAVKKFDTQ